MRVLVAVVCLLLPLPAYAGSGSVADPRGDFPDIVRLTLHNGDAQVVVRQRYAYLDVVRTESVQLRWGRRVHYRLDARNRDGDAALEPVLRLSTPDGVRRQRCAGLRVRRSSATDVAVYTVPRSCLRRAPGRLRAEGFAAAGSFDTDETALTPWIRQGPEA
jgi:hypothetical protein